MSSAEHKGKILNPKADGFEFGGPVGTMLIASGLPVVLLLFGLLCNSTYTLQGIDINVEAIKNEIPGNKSKWIEFVFNKACWKAYLGWFLGLLVADLVIPGKRLQGTVLRDGTQLSYKINGTQVMLTLLALLGARLCTSEGYYLPELQFLYENQLKLTLVSIVFSVFLSTFLYVYSFIPLRKENGLGTKERILAIPGNTGNPFYDWFMGRELNPRVGPWDLKLFCELKPGMLLWLLLNLSCLHHQYHHHKVSDSMVIENILQGWYIFKGLRNEEGLLSMLDITTDGFGFMLCFGDLAVVPFSYSIQARYLAPASNALHLGYLKCSLILTLHFVGYYIFDASNQQKSDFKRGKLDQSNLRYIETKTGSKLLCDGWWSMSQHINYFGDYLIGLSWCLLTGFQTPLTYYYSAFFASLLIHRQSRDEEKCRKKYGKSWDEYQRLVPYKIIPKIY